MGKSMKLVAVAVLFSLAPGAASAWAAPASDEAPAVTAPAPSPQSTTPPSIRASVEARRQSSIVLLPDRPANAAAAVQPGGGRRLSSATKAAIWIAAVTVTSVWAYKTFSVTRGTD